MLFFLILQGHHSTHLSCVIACTPRQRSLLLSLGERGTFRCLEPLSFCVLSLIRCVASHFSSSFVGIESALYSFYRLTYIYIYACLAYLHLSLIEKTPLTLSPPLWAPQRESDVTPHTSTYFGFVFERLGGQKGRLLAQTLFKRESMARERVVLVIPTMLVQGGARGEGKRSTSDFAQLTPCACACACRRTRASIHAFTCACKCLLPPPV